MCVMFFVFILVEPCQIISGLDDMTTLEHETITLVLTLSKSGAVTWMKNDSSISSVSSRFKAAVSVSGLQHSLTILAIECEDAGEFSAVVEGGSYKSSCIIAVKGKHDRLLYSWYIFKE